MYVDSIKKKVLHTFTDSLVGTVYLGEKVCYKEPNKFMLFFIVVFNEFDESLMCHLLSQMDKFLRFHLICTLHK